jgi:predicted N-formylglutamate amidohydrolase
MHTFNPVYEQSVRDFDIGVLTTYDSPISAIVVQTLSSHGFKVWPYSRDA